MGETRRCGTCKRTLTLDQFDALKTCRKCCDRARQWRLDNKERYAENHRRWDANNADRVRTNKQRWLADNEEHSRQYFRDYHQANSDLKIAAARDWKKKHPERARLNALNGCQRRRARKKGATTEVFARSELHAYWVDTGIDPGCCFYCGGPHEHDDHVVPLSRGGTHERANLVPSCVDCNLSKHTKLLHEWRPERFSPV